MKTRLYLLVSLVLGPWSLVHSATIQFPLESLTGTATARKIVITPVNSVSQVGTNIALGGSLTLPATSTMPETNLVTGKYTVAFDGLTGTLTLNVPDTNATYLATDPAVSSGLKVYTYTTPLASGGSGGLVNGATNPVFAGSVGVTSRNTYSSLNLDGAYRGLVWDSFGFTLGDYNAAGQLYIDDTSANFGGGLTVNGTLFSGAHAGDGSLLTGVVAVPNPIFTAPVTAPSFTASGAGSLASSLVKIAAFGNGWTEGAGGNCGGATPPYSTVTNYYPQLKSWTLYVYGGSTWQYTESNFLAHAYESTNIVFFVNGGTVGTADEASVSNVLAHASNAANCYLVGQLLGADNTNGSAAQTVRTNWNAVMSARYGSHFIDPMPYMQDHTNAGTLDAQWVASGTLPLSQFCTNGTAPYSAHFTPTAYGYMSDALAAGVSNSLLSGFIGNASLLTNVPAITGTSNAAGVTFFDGWGHRARWTPTDDHLIFSDMVESVGGFYGPGGGLTDLTANQITDVNWSAFVQKTGPSEFFSGSRASWFWDAPDPATNTLQLTTGPGTPGKVELYANLNVIGQIDGDGSRLTNLNPTNLVGWLNLSNSYGLLPMGTLTTNATPSTTGGRFLSTDGTNRWYSLNGGAFTNLQATNLVGPITAAVVLYSPLALGPTNSLVVDLSTNSMQNFTLTTNTVLSLTNITVGANVTLLCAGSATNAFTVVMPTGIRLYSGAVTNTITTNKSALVSFTAFGMGPSNVVGSVAIQP